MPKLVKVQSLVVEHSGFPDEEGRGIALVCEVIFLLY
jgi:hypothetical protein